MSEQVRETGVVSALPRKDRGETERPAIKEEKRERKRRSKGTIGYIEEKEKQ